MSNELINNPDLSVVNTEEEESPHELFRKALIEEMEKKGLGNNPYKLLAQNWVDIASNAQMPDVKGNLHKDYGNMNRANENIAKLLNPKNGSNNINIALFAPPNKINY